MIDPAKIADLADAVAQAMDNKNTWCSGAMARSLGGFDVDVHSGSARSWCALGHAMRIMRIEGGENQEGYLPAALCSEFLSMFHKDLVDSNDDDGRVTTIERLEQLAMRLRAAGQTK